MNNLRDMVRGNHMRVMLDLNLAVHSAKMESAFALAARREIGENGPGREHVYAASGHGLKGFEPGLELDVLHLEIVLLPEPLRLREPDLAVYRQRVQIAQSDLGSRRGNYDSVQIVVGQNRLRRGEQVHRLLSRGRREAVARRDIDLVRVDVRDAHIVEWRRLPFFPGRDAATHRG